MKTKKALMIALALTFVMAGCAKEEVTPAVAAATASSAPQSVAVEATPVEAVAVAAPEAEEPVVQNAAAGQVALRDLVVGVGQPLSASDLETLGQPLDEMEAPSCHFDGMDTLYFYEDCSLYTYADGDNSVVYLIELVTDQYATPEGATVGMTRDEVIATMGDDYEETGVLLTYTQGDFATAFSFDDADNVWLIEVLEA